MSEADVRIAVSGDVHGHVVIGDHNIVVSDGGSLVAMVQPADRPQPLRRDRVELLPRRTVPPQGRETELGALDRLIAETPTVQVYGPAGIGKTTLLKHQARRLAGRDGGVAFLPAAGRDPDDLMQDVFEACYDAPGYRPTRLEFQRLMAGVDSCLLLDDMEFADEQRDLFLSAMPDATLVFTSVERSLWQEGRALRLAGLAEEPGLALLAGLFDRSLRDDELPLARELLRVTGGSPLLLVRAAADTHRAAAPAGDRPVSLRAAALGELLPSVLDRMGDAARDAISVLAYAGTPGVATEVLRHLVAEPDGLQELLAELAGLSLILETEQGYQLAPGVREALPDEPGIGAEDLARIAAHLTDWAVTRRTAPLEVAAHATLITTVIDATVAAGRPDLGARIARAAAPVVVCSLRVGAWEQILARGMVAAKRAGDQPILAYLTHEDGIRHLVTGKRMLAAAALGTAFEIWHRLGDTAHTALAQHTQALAGQTTTHTATAAVPTAHPAAAHTAQAHAATHTGHTVTGHTVSGKAVSGKAVTGKAVTGKAGLGLAAKVTIGSAVAAVTVTGVTVATVQVLHPHQARRPSAAAPSAATPMIAYATSKAIELRTGVGPARTVATLPPGGHVPTLIWSPDHKALAWSSQYDNQISLLDLRGGPVRHWSCSCGAIAFQGDDLVTTENGTDAATSPHLLVYPINGTGPVRRPITGITKGTGGNDLGLLTALSPTSQLIYYGDAGGSNGGGAQVLYRVDASGHATRLGTSSSAQSPDQPSGTLFGAVVDRTGNQVIFAESSRGGACGVVQSVLTLDTRTGITRLTSLPPGTDPNGFLTHSLWFDGSGAARAAFLPNPGDCMTSGNPVAQDPRPQTPAVYTLTGARWAKSGGPDAVQEGYLPGGWTARLTGVVTIAGGQDSYLLTIAHGRTTVTVPGAQSFAWQPS